MSTSFNCVPSPSAIAGATPWTSRCDRSAWRSGRPRAHDENHTLARLRARAQGAARAPRAGRVVPELDREDVREVFLRAYRIVYRVRGQCIEVLTVFEGHRLLRRIGRIDDD